ncbi:MFS transporter [Actinomadura craniellae]|uniref:MFS transporter n=2 Tax=Actinomadura craniellae TaxID=2231787 RepID=A0A365GZ76_9ACTN|nr:MFS transporter [Actinomadura craniellae]
MVVLSLGVSLIVVDATIVGVLLPRIVTDLGLATTDAAWITSVYSLVFAALLIPLGRAGDITGRRRMFVLGVLVFVGASVFAATAGDGGELIRARALQGVGAAMIMPATMSTVNAVFTGRDRAVAFGIWGSLIGGMAALGPLLGGWLGTSFGWRWAFGVNLPIGLLLVAGALRLMPETRQATARRGVREVDWAGAALAALGLGAVVCGLIEGQAYGWWEPTRPFTVGPYDWPLTGLSPVPVVLALGAVLLALLVAVERARQAAGRPVTLDLTLFRIPGFRNGNLAASMISVGELGLLFVLPLFLVGVHGDSPLQISLAILPLALGAFLAGPYAGRLSHRHGAHRVVQFGMVLEVAAVLAVALTLDAGTGGYGLALPMLAYGLGLGLTSAQLANVALAGVPPGQAGQAAGTQSTARQVGAALGIAVIGTLFATGLGHTMLDRLAETPVPSAQHAALAHELRESAGTFARDLHERPGAEAAARAADESLAAATRYGAYATAAILGVGLLLTLRLPAAPERPEESSDMNLSQRSGR